MGQTHPPLRRRGSGRSVEHGDVGSPSADPPAWTAGRGPALSLFVAQSKPMRFQAILPSDLTEVDGDGAVGAGGQWHVPIASTVRLLCHVQVDPVLRKPTLGNRKRRIEIHAAEDQEAFTLADEGIPLGVVSVPVGLVVAFISLRYSAADRQSPPPAAGSSPLLSRGIARRRDMGSLRAALALHFADCNFGRVHLCRHPLKHPK